MKIVASKWILALVLSSTVALSLPVGSQGSENADVLLQAALHKQVVEGNLEQAISLYKKILAGHAGNRRVAAKALVQMGECYEKLGQDEAQKVYQRVLREYSDQTEMSAAARTRLAAMTGNSEAASPKGLSVRQVWGAPDADSTGSISPDGRYLSFVNWVTANVAVRDLKTGQNRDLTREGTWEGPDQHAYYSVWAADSRRVAYAWVNKGSFELRTVGLDGSAPRVLYGNEEVNWIHPAAWSQDGKWIVTLLRKLDGSYQIGLVSTSDGSVKILKSLEWRNPLNISLSPDDRSILYDLQEKPDGPERDIYLLAVDASRETPVVVNPANDYGAVWSPDGDGFLFASDRAGTVGIWFQKVSAGIPQGAPFIVKPDMGRMVPKAFTRNGAFFYGFATYENAGDVYMATIDTTTGKLQTGPFRAIERYVGSNTSADWSPDGRQMAYLSRRGQMPVGPGSWVLVVRQLDTGSEREITPRLRQVVNPRRGQLRWFPDGQSILVTGVDLKGRVGLYRVKIEDGETALVVPKPKRGNLVWPQISSDGKAIFFVHSYQEKTKYTTTVVRRDLASGEEQEICSSDLFAVSPDGSQVAYTWVDPKTKSNGISIAPLQGGQPRDLIRLQEPAHVDWKTGLTWTPDGQFLLFCKNENSATEFAELWQVSAQGGKPRSLGISADVLRYVSVHPDGKQISYTFGSAARSEVWMMENVLPVLRAAK